ncbi:6-bladed beta-propeller [Niabella sp. W65]|nr:6-bladed beta-propeller [Niabella sp. W65]MCH7366435.1 6-bladed beta-propeller [Niabella sp. W65]ULT42155.1 6-bladed beta-propeller [Niabella sp. I65]
MKFAICLLLTFQVFTLNAVYSQTEIRIDPSAAYGGAGSQIFENIHYIPLETNNESIFGAIDRLAVTKKYFVILDLSTNSILIFKRDGGFYTRISGGDVSSYKGRQANAINDFAIDRDSNKIVYNKGIGNIISYNIDQRKPTYYRIRVPGKR